MRSGISAICRPTASAKIETTEFREVTAEDQEQEKKLLEDAILAAKLDPFINPDEDLEKQVVDGIEDGTLEANLAEYFRPRVLEEWKAHVDELEARERFNRWTKE